MARVGFSLLEVVIAVSVLSIAVLGVMSAMTYSVTQQGHAELVPVAAHYAQQIMEDIKINRRHTSVAAPGVPNAASGMNSTTPVAIDAAPFQAVFNRVRDTNGDNGIDGNDDFVHLDRYQRTITMQRLTNTSTDYRYNLIRVIITVRWTEGSGVGDQGSNVVTRSFRLEAVLN
ncbi:prepilin-type N-terminal cleavage/methylation domain-containing protein [bacterium CPR1]|nr:prepilin-type N-terminal cleavage/methylation domain-containing protein [bacterium CPR1]